MKIDTSKSEINFTIKKLLFLTVKGTIPDVKGEIDLNESNLSDSKIDLTISTASIDTKNAKRNEHLLQEDFFHVEKYPEITFKSSSIKKENETYVAKGELNIIGAINTIQIPFQINNNKVTGEFSLNRMDFKLGKIPAFVASNTVNISFKCSLK
ncbi:YceI family protein [Thalassobellus citreus]|uniref:YceI family protein n=1 Tax=Thalassobellus citreus TaxID=3367752 RepID=UPI00379DD2A6